MGKAYVDDVLPQEMHKDLIDGIGSYNRNNTAEKNLETFEDAQKSAYYAETRVVRAKIALKGSNVAIGNFLHLLTAVERPRSRPIWSVPPVSPIGTEASSSTTSCPRRSGPSRGP